MAHFGYNLFSFLSGPEVSNSVLLGFYLNDRTAARRALKWLPREALVVLRGKACAMSSPPGEVPALTVEAWACSVSSEVSGGAADLKSLGYSLRYPFLDPGGS